MIEPVHPAQPVDPVDRVEPDPGRPYAAYAAALLTVVGVVLWSWLTDETPKKAPEFTLAEFKDALKLGLMTAGVSGLGTFAVKKPLREKVAERRGERGEADLVRLIVYAIVAVFLLIVLIWLIRILAGVA